MSYPESTPWIGHIHVNDKVLPNKNGQQDNSIRTTKYTLLSWLPRSLTEQFRRLANFYFLIISILMVRGDVFRKYKLLI